MLTSKTHHKEIETAEHLIRKTVQRNSLRPQPLDKFKSIQTCYDFKDNFPLYISRQASFLRRSFGNELSVRELFSREGKDGVQPIFPNCIANTKFKPPPKHQKQFSLPNDKITQAVMARLEEQVPLDFFYAENKPQIRKNPKTELPTDGKDYPPEKRLKIALLEQLDEAKLQKLYGTFANELLIEKFREFRKADYKKTLSVHTFFRALDKEAEVQATAPKLLRIGDGEEERQKIVENRIKKLLQNKSKSLERRVIEDIISNKDLTAKNLLGIDDKAMVGRNAGFKSARHKQKQVLIEDDIQKAQEEVIRNLKEIREFKKGANLLAGLTEYSKENEKNTLFDKGSAQKMATARSDYDKGSIYQIQNNSIEKKRSGVSKFSPKSKQKSKQETEKMHSKEQNNIAVNLQGSLITEVPQTNINILFPDRLEFEKLKLDLGDSIKTATESTVSFSPSRTSHGAFTTRHRPNAKLFLDSPLNLKFGKEFSRIKRNAETTKNIVKSYNNFVGSVIEVSDNFTAESKHLKVQLEKVEDHMDNKFHAMEDARESPVFPVSGPTELMSFREHKNFKDKLTSQIIEKIENKDVYINVLEGKKRETKFKENLSKMIVSLNRQAGINPNQKYLLKNMTQVSNYLEQFIKKQKFIMDIESNSIETQVIEEFEVFVRIPKVDLQIFQYPLKSQNGFSEYEKIEGISTKPQQKKFIMKVAVNPECENFPQSTENRIHELDSKPINNRTNYCIGKLIEGNKLILAPVSSCLQLRKSFNDLEAKFKDPKSIKQNIKEEATIEPNTIKEINVQIRKRENLKQIERKLRTYPFQRELLDSEEEVRLKYSDKDDQQSRRLVNSLLDPPVDFKKPKTLNRIEYLKYLFQF